MLLRPGFLGVGILPVRLVSEIDLGNGDTNSTTTVTDVNIGDPFTTRRVVYVITGSHLNGSHPTGITINGVTATRDVFIQRNQGSFRSTTSIFSANVTSGTIVSIAKSGGGGGDQNYAHRAYVLAGGDLEVGPTAYTTSSSGVTSSLSRSVTIPANSVTIGGYSALRGSSGQPSTSWTNITEKIDDVDNITIEGSPVYYTGSIASRTDTSSAGSVTITATTSQTPTNHVLGIAVYS